MEKVDLYEARKTELLKLGRKSRIRGKAITEAWLAAHPWNIQGRVQHTGNASSARRNQTGVWTDIGKI